jgi:hypothetical protein
MRISITILVVAVLAACTSNDAQNRTNGLSLDFEPTPSEPGEEVALVLRNGSALQAGYDLCTSRLSHQRGGQWVLVGSRRDCTTEQQVLEPGGEDSYDFELPEELDGGSYRFSMRVEVGGTRIEEIYSPTFLIPEPTPPDTAGAEAENPAP